MNATTRADVERTVRRHGEQRLGRIAKREGVVTPKQVSESKSLTASGVERLALQGGRETDAQIIQLNKKVIGYVRVHNPVDGDSPCPFCAMLMSRGYDYSSKRAAEMTEGLEQYHYNCHCTAHAVYSKAQYMANPTYELNRKLEREWQLNISGNYFGDEALPVWREHMKTIFPDGGRHTDTAVQEAA